MDTSAALGAIDSAAAAVPVQPRFSEEATVIAAPTPTPKAPARRPGRPPKQKNNLVETLGVVAEPFNPLSYVEMVISNPTMFKKILSLHKAYAVSEVEIYFGLEDVRMKAKDHLGRTTIYTTFFGRMINIYYCKTPISIVVKREYLDHILGPPDKANHKISIVLRENWRSSVYIIVKDMDYDKENIYDVEVIRASESEISYDGDVDTDHPLQFSFDSKHLKSEILKLSPLSKLLSIQKVDGKHLMFTGDNSTKPGYNGIYSNSEKIGMKNRLGAGHVFHISVPIGYIKPFTSSCIGEHVTIAADPVKKISFTSGLDKKIDGQYGIEIKVFSDLYTVSRA